MKFMLFIATDTEPDVDDGTAPDIDEWVAEGERRGIRLDGERLVATAEAKTVRIRKGELLVTDGPFTESKEWIAGFDIVDCESIDEAVDYATRHPMARFGRIEVRAFYVWDE